MSRPNENSIITYSGLSFFLAQIKEMFLWRADVDDVLSQDSENPISNKAVYDQFGSYYTKEEIDRQKEETSQFQIVTWEAGD